MLMMTRATFCCVWQLCQLAVFLLHAHGISGDVVSSEAPTSTEVPQASLPTQTPCGDNLCLCSQHYADCSGRLGSSAYIPQFPDNITFLYLSWNNFSSEILTPGCFRNLSNIIHLDLSYNRFTWLPRSVFQEMVKLDSLVLDGNEELEPASLREVMSIETVSEVQAENCNLPPPSANLFTNMTSDVLRVSFGSNPRGGSYPLDGFCALRYLVHLGLCHCDFKDITSSCFLQELSDLDLTGNTLRKFPQTCVRNEPIFPFLNYLRLAHNRIDILSTKDICLPWLTYLDLSYNSIRLYPTGAFSWKNFPILQNLNLQHQSTDSNMFVIGTRIEDDAFDNPYLNILNLHNNKLEFANREKIGAYAFANCFNLRDLEVGSNNFTNVNNDRFMELFGDLTFLTILSLPNSKLELVPSKTFAKINRLNHLYLHDNIIPGVPDGAFDSLHNLLYLSLNNNHIKVVSENTFGRELRETLQTLTLSFNPLECSCELRWFQHWFKSQPRLFLRSAAEPTDYKCYNIPKTTLADFSMAEQACLLNPETNLSIIRLSSILIFTLLLVSLVFCYRWHIRLLMYETFRGRDYPRRQRLLANNFDFDIFVSYASENIPWVCQHLMPKLEDELGLRLCIHERDFVLGRHIVDNIVECVEGSKKILMVFSSDFVCSEWCQFELSLCLSHVMVYDDAMILVCVDDVMSRPMTSAMKAVLKTTTYIEWREGADESVVAAFWSRVRLALREILPRDEHNV